MFKCLHPKTGTTGKEDIYQFQKRGGSDLRPDNPGFKFPWSGRVFSVRSCMFPLCLHRFSLYSHAL